MQWAPVALLLLVLTGWTSPQLQMQRWEGMQLQVERWEGMLLHLASTLRATQTLSAIQFVCRPGGRCVSTAALRRLDRQMTVTYTMSVAEALPESWPTQPRSLFVLVDLDCGALANATVQGQDVVLLVSGLGQEEFLIRGARAFETCWQADLLNVLAVRRRDRGGGGAGLRIYTYWPYFPRHCHDMRPHIAALWTPATPHRAEAFGLTPKDRDLGGCPLRVTTFKARPWVEVMPLNGTAGRLALVSGTFKPFIITVAQILNFTAEFYAPTDGKIFGSTASSLKTGGVLGDLYFNRSDMVLQFTGADLTLPYHARPATAQVMCTTWCLPTGYNTRSPWRLIVGEFDSNTWKAVLVSYALAVVSYRFLLPGRTFGETWLTAVQGLISGIQPIPSAVSPRVFVFCWSFAGLVLATLYMAALHRMVTTDTDDTVFHSLSELAASDIPLYASTEHVTAYKKAQFDTASERRVWARTATFNYDQALLMFARLFSRRDMSILMDRNQCRLYGQLFTPPRAAPVFHLLHKYCLAVSQAYNLILRQTSPLLRALTRVTARLDEAGITHHWFDVKERHYVATLDPVLRMPHLVPFLKMLGIGCAAGCGSFILELVWYACTRGSARLGGKAQQRGVDSGPRDQRRSRHRPHQHLQYRDLHHHAELSHRATRHDHAARWAALLEQAGRRQPVYQRAYPEAYPKAYPEAYPEANPEAYPEAYPTAYPKAHPKAYPAAYPAACPEDPPRAYLRKAYGRRADIMY